MEIYRVKSCFRIITLYFRNINKINKMKNLMKTSIYLLSFTFLLGSCNTSTKGNWSESDLKKCNSELKKGMYEESTSEEVDAIFDDLGKTTDEIVLCACEAFEGKYSSFSEADNDDEAGTDAELSELLLPCMLDDVRGNMDYSVEPNTDKGSTQFSLDMFMQACAADQVMQGYCSCILSELIEKYTIEEALLLTEEEFANLDSFEDCLELIEY